MLSGEMFRTPTWELCVALQISHQNSRNRISFRRMQARNELCRRAHAYPLLRRCHGSAANPLSEPALGTRQCSPDYRHFLPAPYAAMPGMAALFTQARSKSSPDPTPTWHLHHGVQRPRAFLGEGEGGAVPPCPHTHTRKKIDVIFVLLGRDAFG